MKNRKLRSLVLGLGAVVSALPGLGCSHTGVGAGVGAVGGAEVGSALAGRGKGAQGALIGAGAGLASEGGAICIQTMDENERNAIWTQVDQKVMASGALLPFVYEKTLLYRPENLTNVFVTSAYGGMYDYTQIGTTK